MTVGNKPRNREFRLGNDAQQSPLKKVPQKVPLTAESLAVLGHEIRNPLSALSYALEAWPASKGDPQLEDQLMQIMRRQVLQLTRLCNDLLDVGKSARGSLAIHRVSVDARQIVQSACQQIQPFVEQCGHRLTMTLSESPLHLLGDESRLTQVFANLLHNAAKFTDRNGHLRISIERQNNIAVVRLSDNGRGICADRLRNLFVPDNGSKRCTETGGEGLGIGLRLAKSIVELHGGTIEAFSQGIGHGSEFVVTLPLLGCWRSAPNGKDNSRTISNKGLAYEVDDATVVLSVDVRGTQSISEHLTKHSL
jgi:signal transduction histidine kinase